MSDALEHYRPRAERLDDIYRKLHQRYWSATGLTGFKRKPLLMDRMQRIDRARRFARDVVVSVEDAVFNGITDGSITLICYGPSEGEE